MTTKHDMNADRRRHVGYLALAAASILVYRNVLADVHPSHTWIGGSPLGPYWDCPDNWSPAAQPGDGDSAFLLAIGASDTGAIYRNTLYPDATLSSLHIAQTGGGVFELSFTGTLPSSGLTVQNEYLGDGGKGRLFQSDGVHTITDSLYIGQQLGSGSFIQVRGSTYVGTSVPGSLHIGDGASATGLFDLRGGLLSAGQSIVGRNGFGNFDHSGGQHSMLSLEIAREAGSIGTYSLSGSGQVFSSISEQIGVNGIGRFVHSDTATNTTRDALQIGVNASGRGSYQLTGGTLSVSSTQHDGWMSIGDGGMGTFVQSGGVVQINTATLGSTFPGSLILGSGTLGEGTYQLSGGLLSTSSASFVGYSGAGTVLHSQLGIFRPLHLIVGQELGSRGVYQLSGGTLNSIEAQQIGRSGTGSFLQTGGANIVGDTGLDMLMIGSGTTGAGYYNLAGGSLTAGQTNIAQFGNGTFDQAGGTHYALGLDLGMAAGSAGTYSLAGGNVYANISEIIGNAGSGTLVQSGSTSTNTTHDFLRLGYLAGAKGYYSISAGTLNVTNGGHDGWMVVGDGGTGTFEQSGGLVNIQTTAGGSPPASLIIANATGSSGTYRLSDGTLAMNRTMYVAYAGFGSFIQSGGAVVTPNLTVSLRGRYQYDSGILNAGSVNVIGGAFVMGPHGDRVLRTGAVDVVSLGRLDLNDNDLHVTGGTSYAQIASLIHEARDNGSWNASGITSSSARDHPLHITMLGVLTGDEYLSLHGADATFHDALVAPADVLVKYTYYGDTDFNGRVNFDDYVRADNGFNNHLTGWFNGDFDLNGQVTFDDYVLIDLAFNSQTGTLRRALAYLEGTSVGDSAINSTALQQVRQHFAEFGDAYARGFLAAVPEPGAMMTLGALAFALNRRVRRALVRR